MTELKPTIRRLPQPEIARRARELADLQRVAYTVEAELIGDNRIPQLTETPADLVSARLTWHVAESDGDIVAAAAHSHASGVIDIERLIVHPSWHRKGLGRKLVTELPPGSAIVSTGRDNLPARRLYESLDFRHVDDEEVLPGMWISHFRR